MIEPFYTDGKRTIYNGDCLDILKQFPDKSFDLCLTDPPYGIDLDTDFSGMVSRPGGYKGKLRGNSYDKIENDNKFDWNIYWKEIERIGKSFIIFGGDYFIDRDLFTVGSMSIWDKRLTDSADKIFGSCFETIWFYPRQKRDIIRYKWAGLFGMEKEQQHFRLHPTQKPLDLIKLLINDYAKNPQTILDPFLGSGTTLVAAKQLNRNAVGIEISKEYCEIARKRLEQSTLL